MAAHHRHQASLESILDFSSPQSLLNANELAQAGSIFNNLTNHCEPVQSNEPYKKVTLARLTYEHAESKEIFLHQFFIFLDTQKHPHGPPDFTRAMSQFSSFDPATSSVSQKKEVEVVVNLFGEYLFSNFFSPCVYDD